MRDVRGKTLTARTTALLVATVVLAADQLTKVWAVAALSDGPFDIISGFFRLALVRNPGAAFGMLEGAGSVIALGAIAAAAILLIGLRRIERKPDAVAVALVLGGAVGNLIDRLVRDDGWLDGRVIDFFDFSFFPTFNIADSAITVGAAIAILEALRTSRRSPSPTSSGESEPTE